MRREAVVAALLSMIVLTLFGGLITVGFVRDQNQITGLEVLSSVCPSSGTSCVLSRPQALACPVLDGVVTAGWHDPSYYKEIGAVHQGVDFANNGGNAATCGKEVRAMAEGTAHFMPLSSSSGNFVVIDHEGGIQTRYLHLNSFAHAKAGENRPVSRGEVIGYIGSTGKSTGCHLHFEIIIDPQSRTTINPLEYVCKEKCGDTWCDTGATSKPKLTDKEKQLLVLVDKTRSLPKEYPSSDHLVDLQGSIPQVRAQDSRASKLLVDDLNLLMKDARAAGIDINVQSAFRSFEYQTSVFNSYVQDELIQAQKAGTPITPEEAARRANVYSALPGHSEHQLGTAIDFSTAENKYELEINFADTAAGKWLDQNAEKYGFILSYPKGKETITGYQYEPWHYRYIGPRLATDLLSKNYKTNNQLTLTSFIDEVTLEDAVPIAIQTSSGDIVNYDADISYKIKPSFKETIPFEFSEIEKVRSKAEEISKCKTDDCVKLYNHKEIDGLTWNLGTCEKDDEETFNALTQLIEDCNKQTDNYCSCGMQQLSLQPGNEIILKSGQEATFARNGKTIISKQITTNLQLYSPVPLKREDITEIKTSEFCFLASDFCTLNELEVAKIDTVVFNRRTAYTADLPYIKKCGSKRTILIDIAPSQGDYSQPDLFTVNVGHHLWNALKDTDEGLAITKLSTTIPRGSHADSIDFVNGNKNSAQIFITVILDNSAKQAGFMIRHASNPKSQQVAQLLASTLQASTQEIDFASSTDAKDFLISSTKMHERDIPVVMVVINNPADLARGNTQLQSTASKAILDSMNSYFSNFAQTSRKNIYPFCVESKQKIIAYDAAEGKTALRPLQYKFAITLQ